MRAWFYALFIAAVAHPIGNVGARLAVTSFEAQPLAYTCMVMIAGSLSLLIMARPGPLGLETLRRPETWGYGILQTLLYALGIYAVLYVSGTEASVVMRVSTVMMFIMSILFVGQKTNLTELAGFALMTSGIIYMIALADLSANDKTILVLILILRGLAQAAQKMMAEFHKTNRRAKGFRHTTRVTAFVLGVSSLLLTCVFMSGALIKQQLDIPALSGLPNLEDFFNLKTLLLASIIGFFIISFSKYCEFYAAKKISAKYLLSVVALQPIFAISYESFFAWIGLMELKTFDVHDYLAMTAVIGGSIIITLSGMKMQKKTAQNKNWNDNLAEEIMTDANQIKRIQEVCEVTVAFCKNDKQKTSKLLNVSETVLEGLLNLERGETQITNALADNIRKHYGKNVVDLDALTGLISRLKFMASSKKFLTTYKKAHLLYLDLNKFKPVNDTYGHKADDLILKEVAKRLETLFPNRKITRLGGDEFCVLMETNKTPAIIKKQIKKIFVEQFSIKPIKDKTVGIGVSVGVAAYPKDANNIDDLIKLADEAMYKEKKER